MLESEVIMFRYKRQNSNL